MAKTCCPLLVTFLALALTQAALAAPAPFPKPSCGDPTPPVAILKQLLLKELGAYADEVRAGSRPDEWIVKANTPVLIDGRLMYEQRMYRVRIAGTDRRGDVQMTLSPLWPGRRMVATR